jgi:hypothetical protein
MIAGLLSAVRRIPRAGRWCAVIALVNAAVWAVVIPPFQVPDEISHFGYAQYLAETGRPPPQEPGREQYSAEEQLVLNQLRFFAVVGRRDQRGLWTAKDDSSLRTALATHPSRRGAGGSSSATNQPPLYYAFEAIPYWLSPSHDILTRLLVMRLFSALLAAGTVLSIFLFLRELLPGTPWAWTAGALAVAFQPMFMFISAGVHGDTLLFFASAATLLALTRSFRRGLTPRRGLAIGAFTAIGVLGKLTFLAFVPGIALGVLLLLWREWRATPRERRTALAGAGAAAAVVAVPVVVYLLLNAVVWDRSGGATAGVGGTVTGHAISLKERLGYIWQLALPRLPFMKDQFGAYPLWETFFKGFIGRFGWVDYGFPARIYSAAAVVFAAFLALASFALARAGRRLGWSGIGWRVPLAITFAVMVAGLFAAIGWQGVAYRADTGFTFEQARYLFPLLAFYGLLVAIASRAAGRRWGPALGALIVVLAMAHGLFAELLTISRYYG